MTRLVPLPSIKVPANRQRQEFDETALQELVTSISESAYGLQHPLVVRQDSESDGFLLVAGERRLRALTDIIALGVGYRFAGEVITEALVPVTNLGELSPVDAYEAELEENIRRSDLTLIERAQATAALFDLRAQQAARDGHSLPAASDIAKEIFSIPDSKPKGEYGQATETVRNHLIIARHAKDSDVAKAASVKEAVKIIKKKEEAKRVAHMAEFVGTTYSSDNIRVLNESSEGWMRNAEAELFDVILTDPPYGMGAHEFGDSGKGVSANAHFYDDSRESWLKLMEWFAPESYRITKPNAHMYTFCDIDHFPEMREMFRAAGWNVHRTPLIWYNPDGFRTPWPEHGPQRKYEVILYARKGGRKVNSIRGDVVECRKDPGLGHPAQKPVALFSELLRRSARPGDVVLDPFAGSGPAIAACHELRLDLTAIEIDKTAYGIALNRLSALSNEPELALL